MKNIFIGSNIIIYQNIRKCKDMEYFVERHINKLLFITILQGHILFSIFFYESHLRLSIIA
jgi:hypothetical protein